MAIAVGTKTNHGRVQRLTNDQSGPLGQYVRTRGPVVPRRALLGDVAGSMKRGGRRAIARNATPRLPADRLEREPDAGPISADQPARLKTTPYAAV